MTIVRTNITEESFENKNLNCSINKLKEVLKKKKVKSVIICISVRREDTSEEENLSFRIQF